MLKPPRRAARSAAKRRDVPQRLPVYGLQPVFLRKFDKLGSKSVRKVDHACNHSFSSFAQNSRLAACGQI
jgi:hypothetical protein